MEKQHNMTTDDRSLQERSFDLLGELILEKEASDLLASISEESDENIEMNEFLQQHNLFFLRQLSKSINKSKRNHLIHQIAPQILKIASVFLIIVFLSGSIGIAVSEDLRIQLLKFLAKTTNQYTMLKLNSHKSSIQPPFEWEGQFYLTWLPDDMELVQCIGNEAMYWQNGSKEVSVDFCEYGLDTEINIDTEDAIVESIEIQGKPGYMTKKGSRTMFYWSFDEKYFLLTTRGLSIEDTFLIAENIFRIE